MVDNNLIATGIHISSPVTSGTAQQLYVGDGTGVPTLRASYVKRPTHVLWHQMDLCPISVPSLPTIPSAESFFNTLALVANLGSNATSAVATGGVQVTTPTVVAGVVTVPVDVCGAFDYHGFLGIEPTVVAADLAVLDALIASLSGTAPKAGSGTVYTSDGTTKQIDLAHFTQGSTLTYDLAHTTTSRGGSVTMNGSTVTYTPPASASGLDYFVYVATDVDGNVRSEVVTVDIGN